MTVFEFMVTYAMCWWLVLFMVLPYKADACKNPEVGHAPSAPANPRLRSKIALTTLLAIVPTVVLYFIISDAKAAETLYHVGSKQDCAAYEPDPGVSVQDGPATGGKQVKPATLGGKNPYVAEKYTIPLRVPGENYIQSSSGGQASDLSDSFINAGEVSVSSDGSAMLNGVSLAPQGRADCDQ